MNWFVAPGKAGTACTYNPSDAAAYNSELPLDTGGVQWYRPGAVGGADEALARSCALCTLTGGWSLDVQGRPARPDCRPRPPSAALPQSAAFDGRRHGRKPLLALVANDDGVDEDGYHLFRNGSRRPLPWGNKRLLRWACENVEPLRNFRLTGTATTLGLVALAIPELAPQLQFSFASGASRGDEQLAALLELRLLSLAFFFEGHTKDAHHQAAKQAAIRAMLRWNGTETDPRFPSAVAFDAAAASSAFNAVLATWRRRASAAGSVFAKPACAARFV